ncbi:MAG: MFS transporter, partial [Rothia mucilaginosa]
GGFFPPLVMGATYNQAENHYFVGLMLLAVTAALAFLSAFLVPNGGKPNHAK